MRMGFVFSEAFWGIFLIVIGLTIVVKVVFGINIPLMRIILALLLIYIGVSILLGGSCARKSSPDVIFNESRIKVGEPAAKYDIVFGKGEIDLTALKVKPGITRIKVNTVFGSGTIKLRSDQPVKIKLSSAFAGAKLPDKNLVSFGEYTYRSPGLDEGRDYLYIEASVVFGELEIVPAEGGNR